MAKKINEVKLVELMAEATDNHWFNPELVAQLLINYPIYTQDKIMDLVKEIIKLQALRYEREIQDEQTSEGLIWAARLNETIELYEPLVQFVINVGHVRQIWQTLPEMSNVSFFHFDLRAKMPLYEEAIKIPEF